jgi:hypothetical protein
VPTASTVAFQFDILLLDARDIRDDAEFLLGFVDVHVDVVTRPCIAGFVLEPELRVSAQHLVHHPL